jgi:hypothetical protein
MALGSEQTIPTERLLLVGEVSANFCRNSQLSVLQVERWMGKKPKEASEDITEQCINKWLHFFIYLLPQCISASNEYK